MKRIIAAALVACMAAPVLAQTQSATSGTQNVPGFREGMPYSQLEVDRALPNVRDPVATDSTPGGATLFGYREELPYEQAQVDRQLPNAKDPVVQQPTQVAGPASAGASANSAVPANSAAAAAGAFASSEATGPWANDWNFIAPAN